VVTVEADKGNFHVTVVDESENKVIAKKKYRA